jgi:hypothetical protein
MLAEATSVWSLPPPQEDFPITMFTTHFRRLFVLLTISCLVLANTQAKCAESPKRFIMAHYMPWFQAKPYSPAWGWHWTMNHFNPDQSGGNRKNIASHYYPTIGPYDSGDPDVLKCQVMLMKLSGIDGVIVDWYGRDNYYDYAQSNENTQKLLAVMDEAGMKFAVCYEDHTVQTEIDGNLFTASDAVKHGQDLMSWANKSMFESPGYLKIDKRPILLSFGNPYYKDSQWNQIFSVLPRKPLYFTEAGLLAQTAALGAFDWPHPSGGTASALQQQSDFYANAKRWPMFIAAAYPRFNDIYKDAGVGASYGSIEDRNGTTFRDTLATALKSNAVIVQLVTWNDWCEGTQIEPSLEFGYRDLQTVQNLRKKYIEPRFDADAENLILPVKWYRLRKMYRNNPKVEADLNSVFSLVIHGKTEKARTLVAKYN